MGARSHHETISRILLAFLETRTWPQAKLARHLGIEVATLRKQLDDLRKAGMPLDRDEEGPTTVFWSVPARWFPAGVTLTGQDVAALLRCLALAPRGPSARRLLASLRKAANLSTHDTRVASAPIDAIEEDALHSLHDAAVSGVAQHVTYAPLAKGRFEERDLTVIRVVASQPIRFVAGCHRTRSLKWFRLDRVRSVRPDPTVAPLVFSDEEVDRFLSESVGGYHDSGAPTEVSFFVTGVATRWVAGNLPGPWPTEAVDGGLRVRPVTAALGQVARFVVSLGADARAETPALADAVRVLALGALAAGARESVRSVTPIRSGRPRGGGARRRRA